MTYLNRYISGLVPLLSPLEAFLLIIMVVIINMKNTLTRWKNKSPVPAFKEGGGGGAGYLSILSYQLERIHTAPPPLSFFVLWRRKLGQGAIGKGDVSKNSNLSRYTTGPGLDPNWVTGLVDAEGTFVIFIKLNSNNSKKLVRQIQLSFEICVQDPIRPA